MNEAIQQPTKASVHVHGIDIEYLEWVPESSKERGEHCERGLVIACHGFPDHARTFRFLGPHLARQGYRVVAPNLRGYGPSQADKGPFHPLAIARDIVEMSSTLRAQDEKLFLVGHDWGAAATYLAASALGSKVEKIATLAVPQGKGFMNALVIDPEQQRRSWYMFFFQFPMAEQAVAHDDLAFVERLWKDWAPSYQLPTNEMRKLKDRLSTEGVLRSALSYYRDTFDPPTPSDELAAFAASASGLISSPCLYLHGDEDGCIGSNVSASMEDGFSRPLQREVLEGVGHFLHLEDPERVQAKIVDFFDQ